MHLEIITLVLRAKENELIEFDPSQIGKRLYPYRDATLVGFWTTMEEATASLAATPLLLPLMEMFDVGFARMADVHADLAGKPLAMMEMMVEPPHLPFNLVYEVTSDEAATLATTSAPSEGGASAAAIRSG